jgi:large subunit ribosomal protein L17
MRHQVRGNRLNRPTAQARAMLRNMVTSLFAHERIETTLPKAREARRYAERMITFAKRGDLAARRQVARFLMEPAVLQKLFAELGPRYAERPGGYTRIIKGGIRKGDDGEIAYLELVGAELKKKKKSKPGEKGKAATKDAGEEKARKKRVLPRAAEPPRAG